MNSLLCPPNLMAMGVKRKDHLQPSERIGQRDPDIQTIWGIPEYPVITQYKKLCADTGLSPFGGGTMEEQGTEPGRITSGYRDEVIDDNELSPHFFGFAIDVFVGGPAEQIKVALAAGHYFSRVGLYPDDLFVHLDLAPKVWVQRYGKAWAWVKHNGVYLAQNSHEAAITYVRGLPPGPTGGPQPG